MAKISVFFRGGMKTMKKVRVRLFGIWMVASLFLGATHANAETAIEVWKSPTCGCCQGWVDYMQDNGFTVVTHNLENLIPVKEQLGLTDRSLYSCHTALVEGYVIEGHVPVKDIRRLLSERPNVVGLTAPGMPALSPGMGSIEPKDYDVLSFDAQQNAQIFSQH